MLRRQEFIEPKYQQFKIIILFKNEDIHVEKSCTEKCIYLQCNIYGIINTTNIIYFN